MLNVVNKYAPQDSRRKLDLWRELSIHILRFQMEPVCIIGDYNCIWNATECLTCSYRMRDSMRLNSFILNHNLWDVVLNKTNFTWFGPLSKKSRIDKALLNDVWVDNSMWSLAGLCKKTSDHKPLVLKVEQTD